MNLGIVTVWDERGAGYVSKIYYDYLSSFFNVKIFARGYSKKQFNQDNFVYTSKKVSSYKPMSINKREFKTWITKNDISVILFNEQQSWEPILWCKDWGIKTIAYIDYYTEETIPLFDAYDLLVCNTKRHLTAFQNHHNSRYFKWGTDLNVFKYQTFKNKIPTFFISCGYSPIRKGVDILLKVFSQIESNFKLIIHTQVDFNSKYPEFKNYIKKLNGRLEVLTETCKAPGYYHLADYYVYPSRLEGIGLTLMESIACGLLPIIPDSAPMNEFVPENAKKIKIIKEYSRADGYFWPQIEVDELDFLKIIKKIINDHHRNISSINFEKFVIQNLDYRKNFRGIEKEIFNLKFKTLSNKTKKNILNYELNRPIKHIILTKIFGLAYRFYYSFFKYFS